MGEHIGKAVAKKGGDIRLKIVSAQVNPRIAGDHIDFIADEAWRPSYPIRRPKELDGDGLGDIGGVEDDRIKLNVMSDDLGRRIGGVDVVSDVLANDGKAHRLFGRLSLGTLG